jgi:uncharacterized coiled-coil DUF342 family protein
MKKKLVKKEAGVSLETKVDRIFGIVLNMEENFEQLKTDVSDLKSGQRRLQNSVDGLAKMVKDFHEEIIVTRRRLDVLEAWAKKVSEKVGIPLPF